MRPFTYNIYPLWLCFLLLLSACMQEDLQSVPNKGEGVLKLGSPTVIAELSSSTQTKATTTSLPDGISAPDAFKFQIDIYDETLEGQFYTTQDIEGSIYYNFPYSLHKDILGEIICWNDALFREILLKKLDDYYIEKNTNIKKCQELSPRFITDNFMRYWTYTDYLKDNYFPEKLIDIMRSVDLYISKSDETFEYKKKK